jgi:3-hydroxyisobutyrate dehydrogenase-like beta-hydroxyacid dehydrogenase
VKLGVIGFGEAGFELSRGLKGEGLEDILAFDALQDDPVYGKLVQERVRNSGVMLAHSAKELLETANVILAAVQGDKALQVAQQSAPFLKTGKLYVDVSASSPETKRRIWETIRATGVCFVDAAMLGPLPTFKHQVPILASGNGADAFVKAMQPYGMKIQKVSEIAGEATAIKLVQSIFTKGLCALLIELLEAGSILKIDHLVLKTIVDFMNAASLETMINRLVTSSAIHAERRAHEMEAVVELLESVNVEPTMAKAIHERLNWLESKKLKQKFGGKSPASWQDVVAAWEQAGK